VNSWKIIVAALVIFAAGVITGGVTVKLSGRLARGAAAPTAASAAALASPGEAAVAPGVAFPLLQRMEMLRRLDTALNLSPGQRDSIDALVRESQEHVRKLWEPIRPKAQDEFRQLRDKVKAVLTEEQRAQFEDLMRRRMQRRVGESFQRFEPASEQTR
jgi:Spy/CpxP family protein refolding chaperone